MGNIILIGIGIIVLILVLLLLYDYYTFGRVKKRDVIFLQEMVNRVSKLEDPAEILFFMFFLEKSLYDRIAWRVLVEKTVFDIANQIPTSEDLHEILIEISQYKL